MSVRQNQETAGDRRAVAAATDTATPRGHRVGRATDLVVCLGLVIAAIVFCGKHITGHHQISPYDEYVYIDYYARVLDEGVVRQGDKTEDYARRYMSCHPNRVFGPWQPQLCPVRKHRPDGAYPMAGYTTAGLYPPLYFLTLRVMGQPLVWLGVDFVQAGRYAGAPWLALAAVMLYLLLRRLRVHPMVGAAVALMMVSSTTAYWANTYISTDGAALASGAAMLYLAIAFAQRPSRGKALAMLTVSALVSLIKIQNLEAVVVAGGYLILLAAWEAGRASPAFGARTRQFLRDSRTRVALVSVVAGALAQGAWLAIRAQMALGPDPDMNVSKHFVFPFDLLRDMFQFLPGVAAGGIAGNELGNWSGPSIQVLSLIIVGGVIGLAFGPRAVPNERALGISVLVASLVAGPALSFATLAMNGTYVPVVLRYGAPILPGMLACFALLVPSRSPFARIVVVALAALLFTAGLAITQ